MACEDQISTEDLINAKSDAVTLGEVATSRAGAESAGALIDTSTNRFGEVADTVTGRLKKMGFAVPIVYASSIVFATNDNVKTVDEGGATYSPRPSFLPFTTTGTWGVVGVSGDNLKFQVVQGLNNQDLINDISKAYDVDSLLAMAAITDILPAGKTVKVKDVDATFTVLAGAGTVNGFNIRASNTLDRSYDLVIGERLMLPQIGTPTDATGDAGPFIEHGFTLRNTVDGGGSENFYDVTSVIGIPTNGIYSPKTYRLTGDFCTIHPSVSGEAIFTAKRAKLDPDSIDDLFTAKLEFDHINYVQKGYLNDNTLPSFDGRIFNGDRLYNIEVHHNNFVAISRVVDSRRQKTTQPFHIEGYLQSFHLLNNKFAYCSTIVKYSYGYNVSFCHNDAETCAYGFHSTFDGGVINTIKIIDNMFEGIGVFLKIPGARAGVLHGAHLEMGNSPDASYLNSKALVDLSPAGPLSADPFYRQWDLVGVTGSVPLIYDADDFEFSLISTTNSTYKNIKSPNICFSGLNYRAEHLMFSQGSEVGSPSEASPNMAMNSNFQVNQNETSELTPVVTGNEIDLWQQRSAASAAPITTYLSGFDRGGAYGGSHSFTLVGATKSHFMNQAIPMRRGIVNGIGGTSGTRAFVSLNMDLPAEVIMLTKLRYVRKSDQVEFGSGEQTIVIQAGTRLTHFSFNMPVISRVDDADYDLLLNLTFSGGAGEGTAPSDGTYKVFFVKVELNSNFATPYTPSSYNDDLHLAREVYYRPKGGVECIASQGGQNTVQSVCKTLPLTSMDAASYTITYDSIDTYLADVPTNITTGGLVTFDGTTIKVKHTAGATFNGYEQINGLTITAN